MRKLKKSPILLFVIILIVLYAIIYIIPTVSGAMVSSYVAEYGELKIYDETEAYFVRDESVYLARATGETNYFYKQGSLLRKESKVMSVKAKEYAEGEEPVPSAAYDDVLTRLDGKVKKKKNYRVSDVGVVSYFVDGYESVLTPKNMAKKDYSFYHQISEKDVLSLRRKSVIKGEPVFKIVDRTKWYMVCYVDEEHLERYEKGSRVKVEFEDGDVLAYVYKTKKEDGKGKVILETGYYYDKFAELRKTDVTLVTYNESGVIVENSSIGEKDGQVGVYVKNKSDDFIFVPIKVYATDGEKSLIADDFYYDTEKDGEIVYTVEVYDEILKDAK